MAKQIDLCSFNWLALEKVSTLTWLFKGKFNMFDHGWHQPPLNKHEFSFFMISCKILKQIVKTLSFLKRLSNSAFKVQKVAFIWASDVTENFDFVQLPSSSLRNLTKALRHLDLGMDQ